MPDLNPSITTTTPETFLICLVFLLKIKKKKKKKTQPTYHLKSLSKMFLTPTTTVICDGVVGVFSNKEITKTPNSDFSHQFNC